MSANPNDKIKALFNWCVHQTAGYNHVSVKNFTTSWKNGMGFCAILHRYGPDLIDYNDLNPENIFENCELAFNIAEKHFGIPSLLNPKDMVIMKSPDRLCIITYLSQYYNTLATKSPKSKDDESRLLSPIENIDKDAKPKEEKNNEGNREEESENIPSMIEEKSDNQICAICSETIYFLEKLTVSDIHYHRSCYRQNQLTNLKLRNKTLERPPKKIVDQENESNIQIEKPITTPPERHSRSRLSPIIPVKPARPPSLDSHLSDKNILNNNQPKSLENQADEHSSQSASSVNYISVNASSVESLSTNISDQSHKKDETCKTSNKLHPTLLDNFAYSLNVSFNKKRPAPLPPTLKPKPTLIKSNTSSRRASKDKTTLIYPEDLNPFAEEKPPVKTIETTGDLSNPFAEFMTDDNQNLNGQVLVKPHKRPAPRKPTNDVEVTTEKKDNSTFDQSLQKYKMTNTFNNDTNEIKPETTNTPISLSTLPIKSDNSTEYNNLIEINKDSTKSLHMISDNPTINREESSFSLSDNNSKDIQYSELSSPEKSISQSESLIKNIELSSGKVIEKLDRITIDSENPTSLSTDHSFVKPEKKPRKKKLENKCKSQDSLNNATVSYRNSVLKPPAPSRPLPPKREVRGDNSYEFIPYDSLYSQLKELNEKQSQIEITGRKIQDTLWEVDQNGGKFEELLQDWLDLVREKNEIFIKEGELHEILRRQELEDRHSDLEYELRLLMGKQESQKTPTEIAREEELIAQILDTVNARAQLIEKVDEELSQCSTDKPTKLKKSKLKNFFSIRRRSSSVGKTQTLLDKPFKIGKKTKRFETFTLH